MSHNRKIIKLIRNYQLHLMLLPGLIILFIYSYMPMFGVIMAFQNYKPTKGVFGSDWVGLLNFKILFSFPNITQVIYNTVFIATFKLFLGLLVPVIFALLLNEIKITWFKRITQTIVYLPHFLSWVILGGIFITILSPSIGIVNNVLKLFSMTPMYFLGDNNLFRWTLIVTEVWKGFGYGSIIYLAALTSIDPTLYEASSIDGAGKLRQIFVVTLPGIAPIIFVMAVLSLGNILNAGFDQVFNLYSPQVYQSGDIIDTFTYRLGMQQAQYSISTAVNLFKSVISFILIALSYKLSNRYGNYRIF